MADPSQRLYDAYKRVRNKLRIYHRDELVRLMMDTLWRSENLRESFSLYKSYPPWFLLLLIKWTLREGEYRGRRSPTQNDLDALVDMMKDVEENALWLPQYDSMHLAMRRYLVQQLRFQEEKSHVRFARQALMFGKLNDSDRLGRIFREKTGTEVGGYLCLSIALLGAFVERRRRSVSKRWFAQLPEPLAGCVDDFLAGLAKTADEAREILRQEEDRPNIHYEYFGESPLRQFPLLRSGETYHPYLVTLLEESLAHRIYEVVRSADVVFFMKRFGPIFETYVRSGLDYSGMTYVGESEIPRAAGQQVVDFVVVDGGSNIFIDAKGVELAMSGLLSHRADIVYDRMETSAVKAISQGLETASRVLGAGRIGDLQLGAGPNFLLVVTFKDFYISSGRDLLRSIGQERMDKLLAQQGTSPPIPVEHMYFIPIDDFDTLMSMSKAGKGLASTLSSAVQDDSQLDTKKMLFRMHLGDQSVPGYLQDAYDNVWYRLEQELSAGEGS